MVYLLLVASPQIIDSDHFMYIIQGASSITVQTLTGDILVHTMKKPCGWGVYLDVPLKYWEFKKFDFFSASNSLYEVRIFSFCLYDFFNHFSHKYRRLIFHILRVWTKESPLRVWAFITESPCYERNILILIWTSQVF